MADLTKVEDEVLNSSETSGRPLAKTRIVDEAENSAEVLNTCLAIVRIVHEFVSDFEKFLKALVLLRLSSTENLNPTETNSGQITSPALSAALGQGDVISGALGTVSIGPVT